MSDPTLDLDFDLDSDSTDLDALLSIQAGSTRDRLSILQLISLYSHLVDDFDVAIWRQLFTATARFEIRFARGGPESESVLEGREAIGNSIAARHRKFRALGIQRRHYLTNPAILELSRGSARVMAYLQLANIDPEAGLAIEATGRYDGVVVRRDGGWRIGLWRLTVDGDAAQLPSQ